MLINKDNISVTTKSTLNIFSMRNVCDLHGIKMLEVDFTYNCDNRCPYCYAASALSNSDSVKPKVKEIANSIIAEQKKSNYTTLSFLGGEPLLYIKELIECISLVRKEVSFAYIVVTSTLPKTCIDNYSEFIELLKCIDALHISAHHCEESMRDKAIHATSHHDRNELLCKILNEDIGNCKVAVHINMAKGVCDTKAAILQNYYFYNAISSRSRNKLDYIRFNEINLGTKTNDYSFEKIFNVKLLSPYGHGCYSDITYLFKYAEVPVYLKRVCFLMANNKQASFSDLLKILYKILIHRENRYYDYCNVILPNGNAQLSRQSNIHKVCKLTKEVNK